MMIIYLSHYKSEMNEGECNVNRKIKSFYQKPYFCDFWAYWIYCTLYILIILLSFFLLFSDVNFFVQWSRKDHLVFIFPKSGKHGRDWEGSVYSFYCNTCFWGRHSIKTKRSVDNSYSLEVLFFSTQGVFPCWHFYV